MDMKAFALLRYNRDDFFLYTLAPAGCFLLALLANWIAVGVIGARTTFVFLPILLAVVCTLLGLIAGIMGVCHGFPLAVSFSVARKKALLGVWVYLGAVFALLSLLSLLFAAVDHWLVYDWMPTVFPGLQVLGDPLYEVNGLVIVASAAGGVLAGFLLGALYLRFGNRSGWLLFGIYFVAFLGRAVVPWGALLSVWPCCVLVVLVLLALSAASLLRLTVPS